MELQFLYFEKMSPVLITGPGGAPENGVGADFLHRITTQNFKKFPTDHGKYGAILDPLSHIQSLFWAEYKDGSFWLWTEASRAEELKGHLEKFHFAEDIEIISKPELTQVSPVAPSNRVDQGLFLFDVDITGKNFFLEAPLGDFLDRDKGCFPGQEIIERTFTYGAPAKKLVWIRKGNLELTSGENVTLEGSPIGTITSTGEKMAFAMVKKPHGLPGTFTDQGELIPLAGSF